MARDWRILAHGWIYPDIMFATMVAEVAALIAQVLSNLVRLTPKVRRLLIRRSGGHIAVGIRAGRE